MLDALQALHAPGMDAIMVAVSAFGNAGIGWVAIGIVLICLRRYRRVGLAMVIAVILAGILSKLIIGELVMRPRPCDVHPDVPLLIPRPFGSSFPSGHAAAAFAALSVVIAFRMPKRIVVPIAVLAILIAFSRLYLYVHYPSDVIAGAILGAVVGALVSLPFRPDPACRVHNGNSDARGELGGADEDE